MESCCSNLTYAEWATVALTVATVVLAGVAVFLAIAAFVGYSSIKEGAINVASQKVEAAIEKQLGPKLNELLESAGDGGQFDEAVQRALGQTIYGTPEEDTEQ